MADNEILQRVYPYIGGLQNVSRTISRKNTLYVILKDAGAVDLPAVRQVSGVADALLDRGRLTLALLQQERRFPLWQKKEMAPNWQKKFWSW